MILNDALTERIRYICKERNISTNKLSTMAGLPSSTLRCIFYRKSKNPGIRTLLDVCEALNISLFEFFDDKNFKDKSLKGLY